MSTDLTAPIRVLADLARAVDARIAGWAAAGLTAPVAVVFGADRVKLHPSSARARVRHDPAGDTFDPAGTVGTGTSRTVSWKWTGVAALISGSSTATGADEEAHRAYVEIAVDLTLAAFLLEARGAGHPIRNVSGAFLDPTDAEDMPLEFGAQYLLRFQFGRGVFLPDYREGTGLVPDLTVLAQRGAETPETVIPTPTP